MAYSSTTLPPASRRADLNMNVELTDENDAPLDLTDCEIAIQINPQVAAYGNTGNPIGGMPSAYLSGSLDDGTIMVVGPGVFSFLFSADRMASLYAGNYDVGIVISRDLQTRQIVIGTIAILEGVVGGAM